METKHREIKQRELKFRAWDKKLKKLSQPFSFGHIIKFGNGGVGTIFTSLDKDMVLTQDTGMKDKNDKPVFEGDIFRVEEQDFGECDQCDGTGWYEGGETLKTTCEHCGGTGQVDNVDLTYYLVIVWVQEWCMFATLRVNDEYPNYLANGIEALDEPLFWTYTLEDTNDRKFFLCGNIYETPELLK